MGTRIVDRRWAGGRPTARWRRWRQPAAVTATSVIAKAALARAARAARGECDSVSLRHEPIRSKGDFAVAAARHRGMNVSSSGRREVDRGAALGALVGRHQHLRHGDAVVEGSSRAWPPGTRAPSGGSPPRSRTPPARGTTGISPVSAFCFSTRSSPSGPVTAREKNSGPTPSVDPRIEYSGPSSSAKAQRRADVAPRRRRLDRARARRRSLELDRDAGEVLGGTRACSRPRRPSSRAAPRRTRDASTSGGDLPRHLHRAHAGERLAGTREQVAHGREEWHIMSLSTPPPWSSPRQNHGVCGPLCSSAARARVGAAGGARSRAPTAPRGRAPPTTGSRRRSRRSPTSWERAITARSHRASAPVGRPWSSATERSASARSSSPAASARSA